MKRWQIWVSAAAASALLVLEAGCASSDREDYHERVAQVRPVSLRGDAVFFQGALRVEATVSRVVGGGAGGEEGRHGGGRSGRGRHRHDADDAGGDSSSRGGDEPAVHLPRATGPALTLRVRFENLGKEPLDVQVRDITSDLGSFAVRPEHLLLAPGQSSEVDPMVSQLGVVAAQIPITVVLGVAGKSERQVIEAATVEPAR